ncbi:hypothetical protein HDV06_004550 [Boothiomyces sp. JEL0866]|nr:hypothetical protein HDV06_004550 [Boothiomyces sp. JEL0866]
MSQSGFPQGYEGTPIDTPSNSHAINREKIRKNPNPQHKTKSGIESPFGPRKTGIIDTGINKYRQSTHSKSSHPQLMFRNQSPTLSEQLTKRNNEIKIEQTRTVFYSQHHANKPILIKQDQKPVQKQLYSSVNLGESRNNFKRAEAMKPNSAEKANPVCKIAIERVWDSRDSTEWAFAKFLTITSYHIEISGSQTIKFTPEDIRQIKYNSGEFTLVTIDGKKDSLMLVTNEDIGKFVNKMQPFGNVMAMSDPEVAVGCSLAYNTKKRTSKRASKPADDDYIDEYISHEPFGSSKESAKKRNKVELTQEDRVYEKQETPVRKSSRLSGVGAMLSNEIIFNYPHKGRYCISVREQDVSRLNEGEFLNDTVIEFYIRYLCEINADNPIYQKTHFFNSFFFEQLMSSKDDRKFEFAYERIRKWTNRVDIFEKDYLVIPVNENLHWYLAVVYNPGACLLDLAETECDNLDTVIQESEIISEETLEYSNQLMQELSANSSVETPLEVKQDQESSIIDQSMEIDDDVQPNDEVQELAPEITELPSKSIISDCEVAGIDSFKTVKPNSTPIANIAISKFFKSTSADTSQNLDSSNSIQELQDSPNSLNLRNKSLPKRKSTRIKPVDTFPDPAKCKIFILDSLGHSRLKTMKTIKNYLVMEARHKKNIEINEKGIKGAKLDVPIQPNHCDCGVYLLEYVETFLWRAEELMPKILAREAKPTDWFNGNYVIRQKRCDIQHLMLSLKEKEVELKKNAPTPVVVVHDDDDLIIVE